jgi:hypothetical protein
LENSGNNLSAIQKLTSYVKTKPIRSVLIFVFIILPALSGIFGTHSKKEKSSDANIVASNLEENKDKTADKNFLIGLCTVPELGWEKYYCNLKTAKNADEYTVLFQTFNESSITLNLVFGSKCLNGPAPSTCNDKKIEVKVTYEIMGDGAIIQNTLAGGCSVPNRYIMENNNLYLEYAGEASGTCKEEQIFAARQMKDLGRQKVYFTKL